MKVILLLLGFRAEIEMYIPPPAPPNTPPSLKFPRAKGGKDLNSL